MEASHARLATLIDRACARNQPDLDASALQTIKGLCRQSDDLVLAAWEALWAQLRAPHAQTRLLALQLCAQLFQRSRTFRLALLARLSQFLELVLGFRPERPLPQPVQAAASLREEALELLESWSASHGARHKQLPMAVRYLRDTLQYRFPEVGARTAAAAAEAREREERQRAQLRARLAALLGGEWREGAALMRQLLRELEECFALIEEEQQEQRPQQHGQPMADDGAAAAGAGEDLDWEDVAAAEPGAAAGQQAGEQQEHEGLAAYAGLADGSPAAAADGTAAGQGGKGGEAAAAHAVVLETLAGLYRQLANRALPQVQEWLSALSRLEPEGPQDEQQCQHLLRAATELRAQLAAAKERCDAQSQVQQAPQQAQQAQQAQRQRSSLLPEEVRKKLAAQAPVLPSGTHTLFWDSKSVPTFVSGHGLEVSNHWGPVDVHKELPQDRIDELFMLQMPSRQQPQAAQQQRQQQQDGGQQRQRQQNGGEQQQQVAQDGAAGPSRQLQWPSRQPGSSADGAGPSSAAPGLSSSAAQRLSSRAAKRARRAEERAYNEAIIGGAYSDELLARRLQDEEQGEQAAEEEEGGRKRKGRQAKKMGVKARLAQKLLRGGAVAAALWEVTAEEGEMVREREANRW
ncbi:hypothetical protein ABPG75_004330 [Micractinium tetrahymenae]